jgi:hypothetical protein
MLQPAAVPPQQRRPTPGTQPESRAAAVSQARLSRYWLNDILAPCAPKGSMYHHFPGGKEQITGVCVINDLTDGLIALFTAGRARSATPCCRRWASNW